ncbi:hypothetical protein Taro_024556 [Colocasia esculenta]|uniref:Uncharacterized protein n=1 Tax=Colocasia esculenta TaxID=4460 RepID=A0A843V732_COLES|nr:hypothetical protein [Colocasia esculenta]
MKRSAKEIWDNLKGTYEERTEKAGNSCFLASIEKEETEINIESPTQENNEVPRTHDDIEIEGKSMTTHVVAVLTVQTR